MQWNKNISFVRPNSYVISHFNIYIIMLQVSALLGRIPSAVGYQPTLATDMGTMQERITTTKKGSITSVQVRSPRMLMLITCQHALFFLDYYN